MPVRLPPNAERTSPVHDSVAAGSRAACVPEVAGVGVGDVGDPVGRALPARHGPRRSGSAGRWATSASSSAAEQQHRPGGASRSGSRRPRPCSASSMQASGSSSSSCHLRHRLAAEAARPSRARRCPAPRRPTARRCRPNEATAPTCSGASDAASRASSPPRDRPTTQAARRRRPAWARSQSQARATTSTSMSRSASGSAGVAPVAPATGRAHRARPAARRPPARPGRRPSRRGAPPPGPCPRRRAGTGGPPTPRLGHQVLGDAGAEDGPRVRRVGGLLVAGRPQRHPHRVQHVPVVDAGHLGAPEQPERVGAPVGAVRSWRPRAVSTSPSRSAAYSPEQRPRLPAELEGRLDGHPPPGRRARQQRPRRGCRPARPPGRVAAARASDLLARGHRGRRPARWPPPPARRCPGGRRGSGTRRRRPRCPGRRRSP